MPSSWLKCLGEVNKKRPEGQKIRSFAGEGIGIFHLKSIPLFNKRIWSSAVALRHWIALDDGPDQYPAFQHSYIPSRALVNYEESEDSYGLLFVLAREQDIPWMYSEEACSSAIFPDVPLQHLTRLALANGTESQLVRGMIREQLKTSNALKAAQLISCVDSPSSVRFLLNELGSLEDQGAIPFILRRLEHQLSFMEDLSSSDLKARVVSCRKVCYERLTSKDWASQTELLSNSEECVRMQLQGLLKEPLLALKRTNIFMKVIAEYPQHPEFQGIIHDIIASFRTDKAVPILVHLISFLQKSEQNKERSFLSTLLKLLWRLLIDLADRKLLKIHLMGFLLLGRICVGR